MASLVLRLKSKSHKRIGRVWIAFFYKLKDDASARNAGKYLFCRIDIDKPGVMEMALHTTF